ncbi:hypothetical protein H9P43_008938 [Blastocladiella emersonii ATCC 22665]|nr:hypothetical protein H9P43_008938 [Blastocladiella emersonii ATCC 22665]
MANFIDTPEPPAKPMLSQRAMEATRLFQEAKTAFAAGAPASPRSPIAESAWQAASSTSRRVGRVAKAWWTTVSALPASQRARDRWAVAERHPAVISMSARLGLPPTAIVATLAAVAALLVARAPHRVLSWSLAFVPIARTIRALEAPAPVTPGTWIADAAAAPHADLLKTWLVFALLSTSWPVRRGRPSLIGTLVRAALLRHAPAVYSQALRPLLAVVARSVAPGLFGFPTAGESTAVGGAADTLPAWLARILGVVTAAHPEWSDYLPSSPDVVKASTELVTGLARASSIAAAGSDEVTPTAAAAAPALLSVAAGGKLPSQFLDVDGDASSTAPTSTAGQTSTRGARGGSVMAQ